MLLRKSREIATEGMKRPSPRRNDAKLWMCLSGGKSKLQCCKEEYCIGTWNVRSLSQGILDVVKQEIAGMNIYISGISELKRTEIGKFNSDDHDIYYCGQ